MHRPTLAQRIREVAYLTGKFTLRSGQTSDFYWDKYRFESDPELLRAVAAEMAALLPPAYDKLAGLEMGGIPLAAAIALQTGKPALFVRKKAKDYGTSNLVEGGFTPGQTAVVVEDVITTAGQVCSSIQQMRALGLKIDTVVCAIDRQQGGAEKIAEIGCALRSAFTLDQLQ